ncbi:MAG TPA: sugar ABC transporter permease [Bacillota bacterium]|nr:sugar ABC transporter permease [Bacillota bacterium]
MDYDILLGKPAKDKSRKKQMREIIFFKIFFLLPAVLFLAVFMYYPIKETFQLSMMRASGLGESVFIGFENYVRLFTNEEFQSGLINVFRWAFWSVVIQIPLSFFIAFSLVAYRNKMTNGLRAVYYLASVLPSAIVAMLGRFMFAPNFGIIASISRKFNWIWLDKVDFLGDPRIAFWSVFFVATWAYIGFYIVYIMANIEQIPVDIREAAELDGANRWQYAIHIVLPIISYPLRIIAVLCVVGSLKLFDLPYLLTGGGPGHATKTLGIILYQQGFVNWQYGKAAAVGVVIFLLSLIFTVAQFSWQRKEGDIG